MSSPTSQKPSPSKKPASGNPPAGQTPPEPAAPPGVPPPDLPDRGRWTRTLKRIFIGGKRELDEPGVYHRVSLIAFLAWVGLGADGLSSSAYGPEEAFKALGDHAYLAIALAFATAATVIIISYCYSRIIEQFPLGGGGYVVASRLLGQRAGLVSGSALVIDYVLTISISVAAGADAIFSFLPGHWHDFHLLGVVPAKILVELAAIGLLILLNLRGVRESVTILTPIFLTFIITHAILITGVIIRRMDEIPVVVDYIRDGFARGVHPTEGLGLLGLLALFMKAYSMGGGTYTGIEAVSNGLQIMREPKVETGKRTMALMATSLALTASGLIIAYLLAHVSPEHGKTMNAVLVERFISNAGLGGLAVGMGFILLTLLSEALLLFVAAQAGFIDGPRVMANMATDSWLPHRFAQLSDRLTMHYGVLLMGATSLIALLYTGGSVSQLVVMYSINVFLTFSLSNLAMCRYWYREREKHADWRRHIWVHLVGLFLCVSILVVTIFEKFSHGGWATLLVTCGLISLCLLIRHHYRKVQINLNRLDSILMDLPSTPHGPPKKLDPSAPTAVLLVGSYAGLGIHSLLSIQRLFPNYFKNFIFVAVAVVDAAAFKGVDAVDEVRDRTEESLKRYVELAQKLGLAADYRMTIGTEVIDPAEELCREIAKEFSRCLVFAGKLVFEEERWYQRLLHNETAYQLQRRLQFAGLNAMVLPVRVLQSSSSSAAAA
jgi:amino acid transporter